MKQPNSSFDWRRVTESRLLFPIVALALVLLFDLIFVPGFFAIEIRDGNLYGNVIDILRSGSTVILLALGMTLVIATGGVDLSVGAVMAIAASIAALMMNPYVMAKELPENLQKLVSDPNFTYAPLWAVLLVTLLGLGPVRSVERTAGRLRQDPADGRYADPDDRRPRDRPADHERHPNPDLL